MACCDLHTVMCAAQPSKRGACCKLKLHWREDRAKRLAAIAAGNRARRLLCLTGATS